ncbi:hypothetical protein AKG11_11415 [Shinella sp. SUS2]|nr:hypothetical protein AKG11_11415 [Shinella sp. SUS2]KOC73849.1 hypothetical protein AKG10_19865 [Shinella sp. GWS1]
MQTIPASSQSVVRCGSPSPLAVRMAGAAGMHAPTREDIACRGINAQIGAPRLLRSREIDGACAYPTAETDSRQ